ncbi:hypothetical protein [Moritella viscosa]|uniref:Integral membrane sensor signal transduction histidine kinase n=1 Tax=Moritella viscosa TaxID=80854 RepID=A0ABY1HJE6_9GAMM|nr:hypothetical protein [Moritella viscosa]SGY96715.1 Integral membrane sensor signal transduction histidine kinase [Moritella viscosa]SGZ09526.1 Integral membrane sensor signal transduction histidine kinase [Moritella viscosa]SHO27334.1 Integral membrane sensor signal transduction histidine kinase [Moritella viscosa]
MEIIDNIKRIKREADSLLNRTSGSILTRFLTVVFVTSLIPTAYFSYIDYLQGVVKEQDKLENRVSGLSTDISLLQGTVSVLKLCLSSKKEGNVNSDWYCESAIGAYEGSSEHWPPTHREEVLKRNAIEAMLIDTEYYLGLKRSKVKSAGVSKSKEEVLLEALLNSKSMFALITALLIVSAYMYYRYYSFSKNEINSYNKSSKSDAE